MYKLLLLAAISLTLAAPASAQSITNYSVAVTAPGTFQQIAVPAGANFQINNTNFSLGDCFYDQAGAIPAGATYGTTVTTLSGTVPAWAAASRVPYGAIVVDSFVVSSPVPPTAPVMVNVMVACDNAGDVLRFAMLFNNLLVGVPGPPGPVGPHGARGPKGP